MQKKKNQKARVEIYSKPDCHLCVEAKSILQRVQRLFPFELIEVDISTDEQLYRHYKQEIPVVFVNGRKAFKYRVDAKQLIKKLDSHR